MSEFNCLEWLKYMMNLSLKKNNTESAELYELCLNEIESLRAELAKAKEGIKSLRAQYDSVAEMKGKRIEELERGTVELNDYIRELLCGPDHIITLGQIANAWDEAFFSFGTMSRGAINALGELGIHECEGCGGSGEWREVHDGGKVQLSGACPDCAEWGSHGFVIGGSDG